MSQHDKLRVEKRLNLGAKMLNLGDKNDKYRDEIILYLGVKKMINLGVKEG